MGGGGESINYNHSELITIRYAIPSIEERNLHIRIVIVEWNYLKVPLL